MSNSSLGISEISMPKQFLIFFIFCLLSGTGKAQQIKLLNTAKAVSLRGLCPVTDQVIWISGSAGSVGLSTNGGRNWKWMRVPRYEKSDFRDIEAFSDTEAVIMGVTQPAVILRTTDGGQHWATVFEDSSKTAFLDAMDFSGDQAAAVGDPQNGKKYLLESNDRGKTWNEDTPNELDTVSSGEAYFAASGSNIKRLNNVEWATVSGGKKSRLFINSGPFLLLLNQGRETTGANSIAINPSDPNKAFIVGGDFSQDTVRSGNSLLIQFNPFKQIPPMDPPHGYRSCVEYLNDKQMICCGESGVDISTDGGAHWKKISDKSFHICRQAKIGQKIFLAGAHGAVARLEWSEP
jgi:photosystem II stability/assembly factor-like uncharacterized protein